MLLSANGKINVSRDRISCDIEIDFCKYYKRIIECHYPNLAGGLFIPKYGCHITIGQPRFHVVDYEGAKNLIGQTLKFNYDPINIHIGGLSKGFVGFYFSVYGDEINNIRDRFVTPKFGCSNDQLHITICSTKHLTKANAGV